MQVEQAVYTSLARDGKSGYHLVSRSRGIAAADVRALAAWSPSHNALVVDQANPFSVNYHPLAEGRHALSRTCQGPPEYSGRGGRQIYTHALIFGPSELERAGLRPTAAFRDAQAQGLLRYRADPDPVLEPIELGRCHRDPGPAFWEARLRELIPDDPRGIRACLLSGGVVQLRHPGDRARLVECLLGCLPADLVASLSFSTSLQASASRPFRLSIGA